jgi:hypothetical protein
MSGIEPGEQGENDYVRDGIDHVEDGRPLCFGEQFEHVGGDGDPRVVVGRSRIERDGEPVRGHPVIVAGNGRCLLEDLVEIRVTSVPFNVR